MDNKNFSGAPVAKWLEHLTSERGGTGSNPGLAMDIFRSS
jgi:hypothetical protein